VARVVDVALVVTDEDVCFVCELEAVVLNVLDVVTDSVDVSCLEVL